MREWEGLFTNANRNYYIRLWACYEEKLLFIERNGKRERERETNRVRKRGDKETNRYYTIKKTIKYILIYTDKKEKC